MSKYTKNISFLSYLLFFAAVVLVALGIVGVIWGKTGSVEAEVQESAIKTLNTTPTLTADIEEQSVKEPPKDLNNPDQLIEYYHSQLEQNPQDPNTPAYLCAMGNLYKMKKMDCASAIPYYEKVIIDYPDWEGIKSIYPELASCYEEVNDYKGKIWIHEEMMKRFPEDSQEYLFAKKALGL
ncbi:MAG: tetratricopeptide repeat protein [Candidatus Hydrogenedens sp.]